MSKVYVGVENKSKNVNSVYLGINNIATKIKKIYYGILGVAKLVFYKYASTAEFISSDNGQIPVLSTTLMGRNYGSIDGEYGIYAGGRTSAASGVPYYEVNAYDKSLTLTLPEPLSNNLTSVHGISFNHTLVFPTNKSSVEIYDSILSKTQIATPRTIYPGYTTSFNSYMIYLGPSTYYAYAYDTNYTETTCRITYTLGHSFSCGHNDNYALFGGGYDGSNTTNSGAAFNTSLTYHSFGISEGRTNISTTKLDQYCFFGPGDTYVVSGGSSSRIDAIDGNLTKQSLSNGNAGGGQGAVTVDTWAMFICGGSSTTTNHKSTFINPSLTGSQNLSMPAITSPFAVSVGQYALVFKNESYSANNKLYGFKVT